MLIIYINQLLRAKITSITSKMALKKVCSEKISMAEHYSSFRGPWSVVRDAPTELLVIPMMSNFPWSTVPFGPFWSLPVQVTSHGYDE
jgi:hypothetical protein